MSIAHSGCTNIDRTISTPREVFGAHKLGYLAHIPLGYSRPVCARRAGPRLARKILGYLAASLMGWLFERRVLSSPPSPILRLAC